VLRPDDPMPIPTGEIERELLTGCSEGVGRILYVPRGSAESLAFNLRVADVSRAAITAGTEIPVVRVDDMTGTIALLNVPARFGFRTILRIYSLDARDVMVSVDGVSRVVSLRPGRDMFEPAYAEFNDFPISPIPEIVSTTVQVSIPPSDPTPAGPRRRIWAFVTATNNETQQITTVTPN
jgi:hypothetical protein